MALEELKTEFLRALADFEDSFSRYESEYDLKCLNTIFNAYKSFYEVIDTHDLEKIQHADMVISRIVIDTFTTLPPERMKLAEIQSKIFQYFKAAPIH